MRFEMAAILAIHHARSFTAPWSADSFERMLAIPGTFGFVIAIDEATVGFILARIGGDEAEVLTLAIDPDRRGHALGHQLLTASLDHARAQGAREIFLEVADDNEPALRLYRGAGFSEVGRRPSYYREGSKVTDALILRRPL